MIHLRPYQSTAVAEIRSALSRGHRSVLFVLPTGGGKCLGRGTPILMFDGTVKPVEDVRPGDQLMGPDSRPRNVLSTCTGREPLYRVVPKKGDPYVVNESHVLSLRMTPGNRIGHAPDAIVNITVCDYLRQTKTFRHCAKGWRAAVDFPRAAEPLPIPAYMLGVWLGDGSRRAFSITTGDPEIETEVLAFAAERGMVVRREANSPGSENLHVVGALGNRANRYGRRGNPLLNELRAMGLTTEKRIPHRYLTGTRSERLDLLAGILDTDGSYTGKGFDLCLKSEALFDDALFLARSLGFAAYKKETQKTCTTTGASGTYFRCSISGDVDLIPTRISRKQAAPRRQNKNPLRHGIDLQPLGEGDYFGFTIDGDHLFMLGDFTVTHNTVVFSHIAEQAAAKGNRIAILVHRVELLEQASASLRGLGVRHGLIAAGRSMDLSALVQVASVATLARRLNKLPAELFQLLVVDEAHHSNAGTWAKVLGHFHRARVLGVTATPCRCDGRGLGEWYGEMVLGPSAAELTDAGHLAPARILAPPGITLQGLRKRMGDYDLKQAAEMLSSGQAMGSPLAHYRQHLAGQTAIAFCCSVAHAEAVAALFSDNGIPAASIDGTMDGPIRRRLLEQLGTGELKVLTSCSLIGEGVDVPSVAGCILLRPTQSLSLHLQMIGRCLRPAPGKTHAVVLDHVGNTLRHGLPTDDREWTLEGVIKRQREAAPSVRVCPACFCAMASGTPQCPECGHQFQPERRELQHVEGELQEVIARQARRAEQSTAQSFEDLVRIGHRRGMSNPRGWARHVLAAREAKRSGAARIVA